MESTINHIAEDQLRNVPYHALKRVSCEYRDGLLILKGRLPSYFLKQMAQTAVAEVAGVHRIENQIEVVNKSSR